MLFEFIIIYIFIIYFKFKLKFKHLSHDMIQKLVSLFIISALNINIIYTLIIWDDPWTVITMPIHKFAMSVWNVFTATLKLKGMSTHRNFQGMWWEMWQRTWLNISQKNNIDGSILVKNKHFRKKGNQSNPWSEFDGFIKFFKAKGRGNGGKRN